MISYEEIILNFSNHSVFSILLFFPLLIINSSIFSVHLIIPSSSRLLIPFLILYHGLH